MRFVADQLPPASSRWASRVAVFAVVLAATAIVLHRIFKLPTPVALNLIATSFALALVAIALAVLAIGSIWSNGAPGAARVVFAIVVSLGLLAWPAYFIPTFRALPAINDVSTDTLAPPPFVEVAKLRPAGANPIAYPGGAAAKAQMAAYSDLKTLVVPRAAEEVFDLASATLASFKPGPTVVREELPGATPGAPGYIEAVDRTLVMGFYDDIVIRITGDDKSSRVDVRSASRYGRHDLGRNAERTRRILKELAVRIENSISGTRLERRIKGGKALKGTLKKLKERDPKSGDRRKSRGGDPAEAQRGPEQKGKPQPKGDRQSPGRRQQQFE